MLCAAATLSPSSPPRPPRGRARLTSGLGSRLVSGGFLHKGPRSVRVPAVLQLCLLGARGANRPRPLARTVTRWLLEAVWVPGEAALLPRSRSPLPPALPALRRPRWLLRAAGGGSAAALTEPPLRFALRRVAPQEGGEPHPLHHGPHCQVRGAAPAARAAVARYHRKLPAEAWGAARQQGERSTISGAGGSRVPSLPSGWGSSAGACLVLLVPGSGPAWR